MKTTDVLIIGAGSIGVPLSYYLSEKGFSVRVIEALHSPGRGQNRAAIGGIRATHSDPAKIAVCRRSLDLIRTFSEEHGYDVGWLQGGYLYPVYTETHEKALKDLLAIQHRHNLNIHWAEPEEVLEHAPGLCRKGLRGGTFSPEDGSASPLKVVDAYACLARKNGVVFHFDEPVTAIDSRDGNVQAVHTASGRYEAGLFIDASGAGSREINRMAGLDIPVFPDSHEAGITEPVRRFLEPMVVDIRPGEGSANFYFYQNDEGQIVFCITPDPPVKGTDIDNTSEFLPMAGKRMIQLYPRLRNLRVRRLWRGLYPMTPDGFPIVGFPGGFNNWFLLSGMCGQGFMMGPGFGEITADILSGNREPHEFILNQLSPERDFSGDEMLK